MVIKLIRRYRRSDFPNQTPSGASVPVGSGVGRGGGRRPARLSDLDRRKFTSLYFPLRGGRISKLYQATKLPGQILGGYALSVLGLGTAGYLYQQGSLSAAINPWSHIKRGIDLKKRQQFVEAGGGGMSPYTPPKYEGVAGVNMSPYFPQPTVPRAPSPPRAEDIPADIININVPPPSSQPLPDVNVNVGGGGIGGFGLAKIAAMLGISIVALLALLGIRKRRKKKKAKKKKRSKKQKYKKRKRDRKGRFK